MGKYFEFVIIQKHSMKIKAENLLDYLGFGCYTKLVVVCNLMTYWILKSYMFLHPNLILNLEVL